MVAATSSTFAQGYEAYAVVTREGEAAAGVIARQTPAVLVLRDASGAEVQVRKDSIASMERQELSLMPEGLERALEPGDLRDLLAYLMSLR